MINNNVAFRGMAVTENGVPYNKKNSGRIAGGIVGGFSAIGCGGGLYLLNLLKDPKSEDAINFAKSMINLDKSLQDKTEQDVISIYKKSAKTKTILYGILTIASLATGYFVDKHRNEKAKAEAEQSAMQHQQYIA